MGETGAKAEPEESKVSEVNKTGGRTPLELYLHIPFCIRKCDYCDFLSFPSGPKAQAAYVKQLIRETEEGGAASGEYLVETVFIGGGTPSVLEAGQTEELLEAVRRSFHLAEGAEITLEANPGTVDEGKLASYLRAGINRLSFGLQSARDGELQALGRIHTWQDFLTGYRLARQAGFQNVNIDLMSALPGQQKATWLHTLDQVISLEPEHISAYSLIIEEGTPFYEKYGKGGGFPPLPDEEEEREMYYATEERLGRAGYRRYEISNYARPGFECRHNKGYWTGVQYLGLGLGASSLYKGKRFSNEENLEAYLSFQKQDFQAGRHRRKEVERTRQEAVEEFMFLGLRLTEGVSSEEFFSRFGLALEEVYGQTLDELKKAGLIRQEGERFFLTGRGIDVSNQALARFLLA